MYIDFYLEEGSAEEVLNLIVPRIIPNIRFKTYDLKGKHNLLKVLSARLSAYRKRNDDWRIVVLVDKDMDDCTELKEKIENYSTGIGLCTKTRPGFNGSYRVLNRIIVSELESWFFGDLEAICSAYPKVCKNLGRLRRKYRNPDMVEGKPSTALYNILKNYPEHKQNLAKITAAREIATHMDPDRNTSPSFQTFRNGLLHLVSQ